jgi:hypothetical protein
MEETVVIEAPREVVWGAFVDLSCWADWSSVLTRARPLAGGACLASGAEFSCCLRPFGAPVRFAARVEQADRPARLLWTVRRLGVRSRHLFLFSEEPGGAATRCESLEELSGPLVALAGPLFPLGRLRGLGRRFLEELKAEAERRASSPA